MVFYEDEHATIKWNEAVGAVIAEWRGFISDAAVKIAMTKIIELLSQKGSSKYITDTTGLGALSPTIYTWIREEWRPLAKAAGLQYSAVVEAKSTLARLGVQDLVRDAKTLYETAHFATQADALLWLAGK